MTGVILGANRANLAFNDPGLVQMIHLVLMAFASVLIAGCVGPLVEVIKLDEASTESIRSQIQVYGSHQLSPREYKVLQPISGTSCMNKLWDAPARQEDAINQLRAKALRLGGNGILNPMCESLEGTNLAKNCWQSITCHAAAIIVSGSGPGQESPSTGSRPVRRATAFIVDPEGLLLTAFHVIEDAKSVSVACLGRAPQPAAAKAIARNNDLALLGISTSGLPYLSLAEAGLLQVGDPVFTIGFPATDILGPEPKFTDGSVSSLSGPGGEATLIQMTVPVQPGNSGGPLLNSQGHVVGVVTSTAAVRPFLKATGTLPQNINWAVKSDYAAPLFQAPAKQASAGSRTEAISSATKATCMIEVLR